MKIGNSIQKQICLRVTEDEYTHIAQHAEHMKMPISKYVKKKIFDSGAGCTEQFDRIMQLIPVLHTTIDEVEDTSVRQQLRALVGQICQYLK